MFTQVWRFAAFQDLARIPPRELFGDISPALAVTFLGVPQGVAYALIAGLPPSLGLYASVFPAIIGGLFRSSRHVVTGPTNALSLLVGTIVAATHGGDPIAVATTLALVTGLMQCAAGFFRLGALVDYISAPVVLGYITGAASLIAVGQLENAMGVPGIRGNAFEQLSSALRAIGGLHPLTFTITLITIGLLLGLRVLDRRIPGAVIAMGLGILASVVFDLGGLGVATVGDVSPVPGHLPPLTLPDWELAPSLISAAAACAVLSLVESSSVARSIASDTGQRIDASVEFAGQGLANVAAGLTGGFATSGSLTRSGLNHRIGARTRLSSTLSGVMMLAVLVSLGPVVDHTPIPVLAGVLFVVAADLIQLSRIRGVLRVSKSDAAAFLVTLLATWVLPLDQAIEVGIGISIVLFLRRARLLSVRELTPDLRGRLREFAVNAAPGAAGSPIRFIHLEGSLFFGAATELRDGLDTIADDPGTQVLVLRIKRAQHVDYSTAEVLAALSHRMRKRGQHLLLVGMSPDTLSLLERAGVVAAVGDEHVFPTETGLFEAAAKAVRRAVELTGRDDLEDPLIAWARKEGTNANSAAGDELIVRRDEA